MWRYLLLAAGVVTVVIGSATLAAGYHKYYGLEWYYYDTVHGPQMQDRYPHGGYTHDGLHLTYDPDRYVRYHYPSWSDRYHYFYPPYSPVHDRAHHHHPVCEDRIHDDRIHRDDRVHADCIRTR